MNLNNRIDQETKYNDEIENFLKENYDDNKNKRPDVCIFHQEGAVVIIEFKAPDVDLSSVHGQADEYANILACKSNGKLKNFYTYIVGTSNKLNKNRMNDFIALSNNNGYYKYTKLKHPDNGFEMGTNHIEILFYDNVIDRATKRMQIYKDKLES